MATIAQLRTGLAATTVPADMIATLIKGASPLWLSSDSAVLLAEDLALCHPPLKSAEVRARAVAADDCWRLTVVAHDRAGLLADTAAILARAGYSVRAASVATWHSLDLALHAITVAGTLPSDEQLNELGAALNAKEKPKFPFVPTGRAYVSKTGDANGVPMISVVAPDQPGLLAAICRFFADSNASIQAAWITGEDEANDVFVVQGRVELSALERRISVQESLVDQARRMGAEFLERLFR